MLYTQVMYGLMFLFLSLLSSALNALKFSMKLKQQIKRFLIKNHDRRILRLK